MNLDLDCTADVLAAIPALLGFAPTNSIVGIVYDQPDGKRCAVQVAVRYDCDSSLRVAAQFVGVLPLRDDDGTPRQVLLVAIAQPAHRHDADEHLDAVHRLLTARGNPVGRRLHTPSVDADNTWVDLDTGDTGRTIDYRTSELALRLAVEHGRPVLAARADIAAEFAPSHDPAPTPDGATITAEFLTRTVLGLYSAFDDPDRLTPALAAAAGRLITASIAHRDALLIVSTEEPHAGATTWTRLARQLRGPARIEALALAAACFYAGNDAVRAGLALEAAHDTAAAAGLPDTELVRLLDAALRSGLPPAVLRKFFTDLNGTPPAG